MGKIWVDFWSNGGTVTDIEPLQFALNLLEKGAESLAAMESWELELLSVGQNPERRKLWDELVKLVTVACEEGIAAERADLEHDPALHPTLSVDEQGKVLESIRAHLQGGKSLNWLAFLTNPAWKPILQGVTVRGNKPTTAEEFGALLTKAKMTLRRAELMRRWERQITAIGGPTASGIEPERFCQRYIASIENSLNWRSDVWKPLEGALTERGFKWNEYIQSLRVRKHDTENAEDLQNHIVPDLLSKLRIRVAALRLVQLTAQKEAWVRLLVAAGSERPIVAELWDGIASGLPTRYKQGYERLTKLKAKALYYERRQSLLTVLSEAAPGWVGAIRKRRTPHGAEQIPGDVGRAWLWRQLEQELSRRDTLSPEELERQREQLGDELRTITASLVEARAWEAQIRRTTIEQRQALMGWLGTVKKIGKGTGKRAPLLRREARVKMQQCRSAVPVWILPISRLVENFDPGTTRFDVVIIDEASQADAMGLIPLYMAKSVIVVGDNEQVSPDAVGDAVDRTQRIIEEHLQGIPNAVPYDGQRSIYDIALESFGGHICLTEHFRCAPEIIEFSNALSYAGKIRPLRDMSAVSRRPAVIPYRVQNASTFNKVNQVEAETIVSLLVAAIEQPEYADAAFGVISMVGDEQARVIDSLLKQRLSPSEYERRRIICGIPPQFQGDERDVIFLSMVDSGQGTPLPLRGDGANGMFKKRFNVAASRARDQMWVVYSLQPETELKPDDIRLRLINHALNPTSMTDVAERVQQQAESEFERQVIKRLVLAGFRVTPQWRVGAYRIDIVVDDGERRLAIECDGDRYHTADNLAEDMARQAILERLGWRFERIRGSSFFRDPDRAMRPVFDRLTALEITPIGVASAENDASSLNFESDLIRRIIYNAAKEADEMALLP